MIGRSLRGCPGSLSSAQASPRLRALGPLARRAALLLLLAPACSKGGAGLDKDREPLDFSGLGGEDDGGGAFDLAFFEDLPATGADLRGGGIDMRGGGIDMRADTMDLRAPGDMNTGRPPCLRGAGFAAFRFHYEAGSTSARVDAFGLPDRTNFQAVPAYATSVEDLANGGGLYITGGNWILIRFSLVGLSRINSATLSMKGRSYSTGSSGSFEGWSPLYGSINTPINAVSNAWPYSWTSVEYSSNVRIGDDPGLTGIRFYARGNSNSLVINTVELCIDGS